MANYDFSTLNDKEFEHLVNDLLSEYFAVLVERFKAGKDKGIDGRFYSPDSGTSIIQSKHYLKSGFSKLITELKKTEVQKVKILNPKRYIFATCLELSPDEKDKLLQTFSPYIKRTDDVFGRDELNFLIDSFPKVEKRHFKLWLSSSQQIEFMLDKHLHERSRDFLSLIEAKKKFYVETNDCRIGFDILNEHGVLIVSGEPGAGKTTLAQILCLLEIANGYSIFEIRTIEEGEKLISADVGDKQLFLFDDFLGSNYLEAMQDNKDSHIVRFIDRIRRSSSKKIILTSRTVIYQRGIQMSDHFLNNRKSQNEYLIAVNSISKLDKARILYNHIWHGDLSENFIDELYFDQHYKEIINHKNFNPRIVQFITMSERLGSLSPKQYMPFVRENLDNPKDIWGNYFEEQMDEYQRVLVELVVYSRFGISEPELKKSFNKILRYIHSRNLRGFNHAIKFDRIVEVLVGSVLSRRMDYWGKAQYSTFNPSIDDYILEQNRDAVDHIVHILSALGQASSLYLLSGMAESNKIDISCFRSVVLELVKNHSDFDVSYEIELAALLIDFKILEGSSTSFVDNLIDSVISREIDPSSLSSVSFERTVLLFERKLEHLASSNDHIGLADLFVEFLRSQDFDNEELVCMCQFCEKHQLEMSKQFAIAFCESVANSNFEFVTEGASDYLDINIHDLQEWLEGNVYFSGEFDNEVLSAIANYVEDAVITEYPTEVIGVLEDLADISVSELIFDKLDKEDILQRHFESAVEQGSQMSRSVSSEKVLESLLNPNKSTEDFDPIEDLFER